MLEQSCQAKTWQEVKASNPPSRRFDHTAVMDAQQRMWIFGGDGDHSGQGAKVIFGLCLCVCVCVLKILAGVTRGMLKSQCSRKIKAVVFADRCNLVFRHLALF